jgi:hypothetical protein
MMTPQVSGGSLGPTEGAWLTVIVDRHLITLHEFARPDDQTSQYALSIDGVQQGNLTLPGWLLPAVAVGTLGIAIWGSTTYYLLGFGHESVVDGQAPGEVTACFPLADSWLVLSELGVQRVDPHAGEVLAEYGHDEVRFFDRWSEQGLVLQDWNEVSVLAQPGTMECSCA